MGSFQHLVFPSLLFFMFEVEFVKRIAIAVLLRLNLLISLYFFYMTIESESNDGVVYCMSKQIRERELSLKYMFLSLH